MAHNSFLRIGISVVAGIWPAMALGDDYPSKPIRVIASEPGGTSDFTARTVVQRIAGALGQPVVVENRGGTGVIAAQTVAKAAPDGYTLLNYGSNIWLLPFMQDNLPYDPVKDLAPITIAIRSPNVLVVHPSLPVKSVKELIALAKARPGVLNYAAGGVGSSNHLAGELFKSMADVNIVRVAYKGTALAYNSLIAGETHLMFGSATQIRAQVKAGRLRALAVTSAQPSLLAPGLPTVTASGLPGFESTVVIGQFAPASTPPAIVSRLNQEIVKVLKQDDVRERLLNTGAEPVGNSPAEFATFIKGEMSRLGKIIKEAGIRTE